MVQISSKNSKLFLSVRSQLTVIDLTLQTKGQPMDIEHKMNMAVDIMKFIFESQQLFRIPIWFIMILYYKIRQILLQNKTFILLKIVKITTKCVRFLLQNVIVLLQNQQFYYKLQDLLKSQQSKILNYTNQLYSVISWRYDREGGITLFFFLRFPFI